MPFNERTTLFFRRYIFRKFAFKVIAVNGQPSAFRGGNLPTRKNQDKNPEPGFHQVHSQELRF